MDTYGRWGDQYREAMPFADWYEQVDVEFVKATSMDRDSWLDANYYDMWECGFSPIVAVANAIAEEYGEMGADAFGLLEVYKGSI
jgi:hypothetical protein